MTRAAAILAAALATAATPRVAAQAEGLVRGGARIVPAGAMRAQEIPRLVPDAAELAAIEIDPEVAALVARLGADAYAVREAATTELVARETPPAQLVALLDRAALDAEQRFRVLEALRRLLVDAPRGALGIRMDVRAVADEVDPGVEVTDLIAGMPAERILQVNDRITHIEDRPLRTGDDLVSIVQSRRPGEIVRLTVRRPLRGRDGELVRGADDRVRYDELRFDVPLGSVDDLGSPDRGPDLRGPVVAQRAVELQEVTVRYGPRARRLPVEASDASRPLISPAPPEFEAGLLDDHPLLVQLQTELMRIREGRMRADADFRMRWSRELQRLLDAAASRDIDAYTRERMLALADRLQELVRSTYR